METKLILPKKADEYTLDVAADHTADLRGKAVLTFGQENCVDEFRIAMLGGKYTKGLITLTEREWVGLNVLARDGKLEAFVKSVRPK